MLDSILVDPPNQDLCTEIEISNLKVHLKYKRRKKSKKTGQSITDCFEVKTSIAQTQKTKSENQKH